MAVRLQRAARAKVAPEIERDVLRLAIEQPAFGQDWVASRLSSRLVCQKARAPTLFASHLTFSCSAPDRDTHQLAGTR
jgi:hypothetical protein